VADAISVDAAIPGNADKTITFSAGKLAGQADGAVTVRIGDTVMLVTATAAKSARDGADFFPLTVDIEERMYAAGRIPGSFFRREGKASDQAILTCRLMDRPLRPCFPDGFRNEVHVVGTVLAADLVNPHDVVAINGASAALTLSGIPFDGPIGAVRLAFSADGQWIPHPTYEEGSESQFEIVVAGRALGTNDVAISMVEAGGTEAQWPAMQDGAPKVDEAELARGLEASKQYILQSIAAQNELVAKVGKKEPMAYSVSSDYSPEILAAMQGKREQILAQGHSCPFFRGWHPSFRSWFRSVPAWRDPGSQRHHARHAPHGANDRRAWRCHSQALHAPLQLPALLNWRDRLHAWTKASRNRTRHAR